MKDVPLKEQATQELKEKRLMFEGWLARSRDIDAQAGACGVDLDCAAVDLAAIQEIDAELESRGE